MRTKKTYKKLKNEIKKEYVFTIDLHELYRIKDVFNFYISKNEHLKSADKNKIIKMREQFALALGHKKGDNYEELPF